MAPLRSTSAFPPWFTTAHADRAGFPRCHVKCRANAEDFQPCWVFLRVENDLLNPQPCDEPRAAGEN